MFVDPVVTSLLLDIFADVTREGVPRLFAYLDRRYGTSEYDLSGGAPITTRVRFTFRTVPGTAPYWVLLGMQSGDGKRFEVPVRYGDPLELVVPRAWYEFVALFLSKPLTRTHKPTLLALAATYEGVLGARQQQVSLVGQYPSKELLSWLDERVPPAERPFRLPTRLPAQLTSGQPAAAMVLRTRPAPTSAPASVPTPVPRLRRQPITGSPDLQGLLGARTPPRRLSPAPSSLGTPVPSSMAPRPGSLRTPPKPAPAPTPAKSKPATPPDGQCQARTRRGTRCQNWSEGARGNVCDMHLDMVAQGKTVLWYASGKPIRLRKS